MKRRIRWLVRSRHAAALVCLMIALTGQSAGPPPVAGEADEAGARLGRVTPVTDNNFFTRDFLISQFAPGGRQTSAFLCRAGTYTNDTGACDPIITVPTRTLEIGAGEVRMTPLGGPGVTTTLRILNVTTADSQTNSITLENNGSNNRCTLTCNSATNATLSCTNLFPITCVDTLTLQ